MNQQPNTDMSIVNPSILNIVNTVCNFFTQLTDIPTCSDPVINMRMRELMVQNPVINIVLSSILSELLTNMKKTRDYDHYNLEKLESFERFQELLSVMTSGWFNYDKYIGQYSEHEIGDMVYMKIHEAIIIEVERLYMQYQSNPMDELSNLLYSL